MSSPVRSFRDLHVWQRAMELVTECYQLSQGFPDSELYGLKSQLQRAAVSVPANIAEGWGRDSTREFLRHLSVAHGSLAEIETHIEIAYRLGYLVDDKLDSICRYTDEVGKMIAGLKRSLRRKLADS